MIVRTYNDSDGRCFARMIGGCAIFCEDAPPNKCGTYACRWYKPYDSKDWIRLDNRRCVCMYPPEEVEYVENKFKRQGSEI